MKPSEYVAKHANDNQTLELDESARVSELSLAGEVITISAVKAADTKHGSTYVVAIDDGSWFFATNHTKKQIDAMIRDGVTLPELVDTQWLVTKKHIDAHDDKNGRHWDACDIHELTYVGEVEKDDETEETDASSRGLQPEGRGDGVIGAS